MADRVTKLSLENDRLFNTAKVQRAYDVYLIRNNLTSLFSNERTAKFLNTLDYVSRLDGHISAMATGLGLLAGIEKKDSAAGPPGNVSNYMAMLMLSCAFMVPNSSV